MTLRLGGDGAITGCTSLENPDLTVSGLTISGSFDAEKVLVASGTAAAPSYTFSGDTDNGLYYAGTNSIGLSTAGTNAILIDSTGNVGLGTSSPSALLDAYAGSLWVGSHYVSTLNTDYRIRLRSVGAANNNNYTVEIGAAGSGPQPADSDFTIYTQTWNGSTYAITEKMRVTAAGRVGIGTTSPDFNCHVIGTTTDILKVQRSGAGGGAKVRLVNGDGNYYDLFNDGAEAFDIQYNGTSRLKIDSSGNVGIGTTSPWNQLEVNGEGIIRIRPAADNTSAELYLNRTVNAVSSYRADLSVDANGLFFRTTGSINTTPTEKVRIDGAGRLLVGTNSPRANFFHSIVSPQVQQEGIGDFDRQHSITSSSTTGHFGASLILAHQKSGTLGGNTLVADNDSIGIISFQGSDGVQFVETARIESFVDGTPGANDMPGRLVFSTTADGASSPTERVRIDSSGNVGIGTTSPGYALDVASAVAQVGNSTDAFIQYKSTAGNWHVGANNSNAYAFYSGTYGSGTERARIDSSGNVGIGTTSDPGGYGARLTVEDTSDCTLTVNTSGATNASRIVFRNDYFNGEARIINATGGSLAFYDGPTTERARIDSSGRLLVGTSSARSNFFNSLVSPQIQLEGASDFSRQSAIISSSSTASWGAVQILAHQKSNSIGGNTLVADNDSIGIISFQGSDGVQFVETARIESFVDGTPGANDMPGRLVFSTTADGAPSPTERMRIDSAGIIYHYSSSDGIVTSTSGAAGTSVYAFVVRHSATAVNTGTDSLYIFNNGNVQNTNNSYGAISDAKLKENIVDASSQWDDLKAIQVRNYNFIEGQTHTQIGVVAQEVETVSPGLVTQSPDRDEEGNDLGTVTKSVNYSVLYMKAVKALQEAMERIEILEQRLSDAGIA